MRTPRPLRSLVDGTSPQRRGLRGARALLLAAGRYGLGRSASMRARDARAGRVRRRRPSRLASVIAGSRGRVRPGAGGGLRRGERLGRRGLRGRCGRRPAPSAPSIPRSAATAWRSAKGLPSSRCARRTWLPARGPRHRLRRLERRRPPDGPRPEGRGLAAAARAALTEAESLGAGPRKRRTRPPPFSTTPRRRAPSPSRSRDAATERRRPPVQGADRPHARARPARSSSLAWSTRSRAAYCRPRRAKGERRPRRRVTLLGVARAGTPRSALKLSAAFGGANAALVVARDPAPRPAASSSAPRPRVFLGRPRRTSGCCRRPASLPRASAGRSSA